MLKGFKQIEFNNKKKLISAVNKKTAGIIIEPIQGEGGNRPANLSFLKLLRKICKENNILLFYQEHSIQFLGFLSFGRKFPHLIHSSITLMVLDMLLQVLLTVL